MEGFDAGEVFFDALIIAEFRRTGSAAFGQNHAAIALPGAAEF